MKGLERLVIIARHEVPPSSNYIAPRKGGYVFLSPSAGDGRGDGMNSVFTATHEGEGSHRQFELPSAYGGLV